MLSYLVDNYGIFKLLLPNVTPLLYLLSTSAKSQFLVKVKVTKETPSMELFTSSDMLIKWL